MGGWSCEDRDTQFWKGVVSQRDDPTEPNHLVTKRYLEAEIAANTPSVRTIISGGQSGTVTGNAYMDVGEALMGATEGIVMMRSGSITGISGVATMFIPDESVSGIFQIRKNGTVVFQVGFDNTTEGSSSANTTQAVGTDTFVAGDVLSLSCECGATTISNVFISAELTF